MPSYGLHVLFSGLNSCSHGLCIKSDCHLLKVLSWVITSLHLLILAQQKHALFQGDIQVNPESNPNYIDNIKSPNSGSQAVLGSELTTCF